MELIEKATAEIEKFNDAFYNFPDIDGYYSDIVRDMQTEAKLTKKERKKKALEVLKEQCPKFIALLDKMDLLADGMEIRIAETMEKFEDMKYKLDEIEEIKQEVEDMKDAL